MTLGRVFGKANVEAGQSTKGGATGGWRETNAFRTPGGADRPDKGDRQQSHMTFGNLPWVDPYKTPFVSGVTPQKRRDMAALRTGGVAPVGQRTAPIIPFPSEQRGWDEEGGGFLFSGSPTGSPAGGATIGQKDITVRVALANNLSYEYDDGWW